VKNNTLKAFENQLYPFDQLVEKLNIKQLPGRNPLFDAAFILMPLNKASFAKNSILDNRLKLTPYPYENKTSMFDLCLMGYEESNGIAAGFQYRTKLFKRETIQLMKERFITLINCILENPEKKVRDLDYIVSIEKEMDQPQTVEFQL
jgi:non-ribosomal peptide synthetase component F